MKTELIEITVESLQDVMLVRDAQGRVAATVYAIVVSRKCAGRETPTVGDLVEITGFPEAMVYKAVVELVHDRLLHWTVISPDRSASRVTVA